MSAKSKKVDDSDEDDFSRDYGFEAFLSDEDEASTKPGTRGAKGASKGDQKK